MIRYRFCPDTDEMSDGFPKACEHPEGRHRILRRRKVIFVDTPARRFVHMSAEPQITEALVRAAQGDEAAIDALIPRIYATLRYLASRQRAHEAAHTLETTALVHEAYLKLAAQSGVTFTDRAHLYAYMSQVMRHILIDHARRKKAQKRQMPEVTARQAEPNILDVLAIDEALSRLADTDQRLAQVAELRLFADLSSPEIAQALGVTARTVERDWLKARTFLSACLTAGA
jgi:RNA polymerase sigma factor (TIGR02999 family)